VKAVFAWLQKKTIKRKRKSGQAIVESIFGILIFTILLALIMSITAYLYFQQALVTAAREGARQASLNSDIGAPGTENAGVTYVKNYVIDEIQKLTGQVYSSTTATITISPPSQSPNQTNGKRMVIVTIDWKMKNPVNIAGLLNALGTDGSAFDVIPVYATATMRYEE
jgi:uncharacterized protein (UPF0333 family)